MLQDISLILVQLFTSQWEWEIEEEMDTCLSAHPPFLMDKMTIVIKTLIMVNEGPYGPSEW